jgi:hypothetical protein
MFALLSVIECPGCREMMPLGGMNLFDELYLIVLKCSKCELDIQVRRGKNDELIVEPLKKH